MNKYTRSRRLNSDPRLSSRVTSNPDLSDKYSTVEFERHKEFRFVLIEQYNKYSSGDYVL